MDGEFLSWIVLPGRMRCARSTGLPASSSRLGDRAPNGRLRSTRRPVERGASSSLRRKLKAGAIFFSNETAGVFLLNVGLTRTRVPTATPEDDRGEKAEPLFLGGRRPATHDRRNAAQRSTGGEQHKQSEGRPAGTGQGRELAGPSDVAPGAARNFVVVSSTQI